MFPSTFNTRALSYAGSDLQVTGKVTGKGKRLVKKVMLEDPVQRNPDEKWIALVKLYMPKEVLDEIKRDEKKLVEAVTKLMNEARAGPLKGCKTAEARHKRAKTYFVTDEGKAWMRERFLPHSIEASSNPPAMAAQIIGNNTSAASGPGPAPSVIEAGPANDATSRLVSQVASGNSHVTADNIIAVPGFQMQAVGQAVPSILPEEIVAPLVANQDTVSATTGQVAIHRRAYSDSGLNAICPRCGNPHLPLMVAPTAESDPVNGGAGLRSVENNDRMTVKRIVRNARGPVGYFLMGVGLTQIIKGYPKA